MGRIGQSRQDNALGHDVFDHFAIDIGQPEVATSVSVGQTFVVDAEEVEDGGVEIVEVDFALDSTIAVFVGRSTGDATFYSSTGKEGGETVGVVTAAVAVDIAFAIGEVLVVGSPAELSGLKRGGCRRKVRGILNR